MHNYSHKTLVINDIDNINYQHSSISNNTNVINELVEIYKENPGRNAFDNLTEYSKETGNVYKVKDINELREFFEYGHSNYTWYNFIFKWADVSDIVTFVTHDGIEIEIPKIVPEVDKVNFPDIDFIKIKDPCLISGKDDNYILIHRDFPNERKSWSAYGNNYMLKFGGIDCPEADDAIKDFNGYINTYESEISNIEYFPAFEYVKNVKVNDKFQGYMPSAGQMKLIIDNADWINALLHTLNNKRIWELISLNNIYWTSTEKDLTKAYTFNHFRRSIEAMPKIYNNIVMPLFKKID